MAKNDKKKHQAQIDTQGQTWDRGMSNLNNTLGQTQNAFMGNYNQGTGMNMGSYNDIMGMYKGIYDDEASGRGGRGGPPGYGGSTYTPQTIEGGPDPFASYGGYTEFSKTGGLSEGDQANMRARGIAPTRAIYQNAIRQINRNKALQGGYAPNAIAALAKNKREMSQEISDANINTNAGIAQMVQQGKLAGLGGMSGIEGQRYNRDFDIKKFNAGQQNWAEENRGADNRFGAGHAASTWRDPNANRLAALQGMTSLYGATPGMANLFGGQVLQNQGQMMDAQRMQGDWGQNQINQQQNNSQIKGNFRQFMDAAGQGLGLAGRIGAGLGTFGASEIGNQLLNRGSRNNYTPSYMTGMGNYQLPGQSISVGRGY